MRYTTYNTKLYLLTILTSLTIRSFDYLQYGYKLYTNYTTDYYKLYTNYTTYDYKMNTNYTTYNATYATYIKKGLLTY